MEEINNDKEKTNEEVKEYSFAKYLSNLREKRNLTQKALAEKIQVSDRTISKWENGFTVPDLHNIRAICKELGVSANSVVLEKNSLSDYIRKFFQLLMKLWKHIFNNIVKLIFLVIFILLLIYFINNYNSVSIYILNYDSNDIKIGNGYFIRSKVSNILLIDNISIDGYEDGDKIELELYALVNGDKITIYENNNLDDIFIEELSGYPDVLYNDVINSITKNLYLDITTYDENNLSETLKCRINFRKNFSNNKLIYSGYQVNQEYKNDYQNYLNENNLENISYKSFNSNINYHYSNLLSDAEVSESYASDNDDNNKLKDLGYTYNKESDTYTKVDGRRTITYNSEFNVLISHEAEDDIEYSMYYYIKKDKIFYEVYDENNSIIVKYKHFVSTNDIECLIGKCNIYIFEINYILKEYQEILNTL